MFEYSVGAITYTIINQEIYYLLIKDFHLNWGFAKGHVEKNETLIEAAKREIKEEVGLKVEIDTSQIEELIYPLNNGNEKHSIYFVGKYLNQEIIKQDEEVSETKLLNYEECLKQLSFDNMKMALKNIHPYILKKEGKENGKY